MADTIDAELTEIFNDLSISVYKAEIDTIDSLMEDGKKRTKALLVRELIDELTHLFDRADGDRSARKYTSLVEQRVRVLKEKLSRLSKEQK